MTAQEARSVARQERFIAGLRVRLHYLAGRREDRLVFDQQAGARAASSASPTRATRRASEQLMQRYYRAAKLVRQANVILLQNLQARLLPIPAEPRPLADEFLRHRGPAAHPRRHAVRAAPRRDARRLPDHAAPRRT